jgi:hypothetical protein
MGAVDEAERAVVEASGRRLLSIAELEALVRRVLRLLARTD